MTYSEYGVVSSCRQVTPAGPGQWRRAVYVCETNVGDAGRLQFRFTRS